jgi:hypothetical protein
MDVEKTFTPVVCEVAQVGPVFCAEFVLPLKIAGSFRLIRIYGAGETLVTEIGYLPPPEPAITDTGEA